METDRILLRHWQDSDADVLYEYAKEPEVGERAGWPPHNSLAHKWSFHRQSRFGKGDGEMWFRGNRRNSFRQSPLWRREQTDKSSEIGVLVTGLSLSCNKKHPSPFVTFSVILSQIFGKLANYHYLCSHKNKI